MGILNDGDFNDTGGSLQRPANRDDCNQWGFYNGWIIVREN
jgi:hypothetical protein